MKGNDNIHKENERKLAFLKGKYKGRIIILKGTQKDMIIFQMLH